MLKCANCDREALYLYQLGDSFKLYFCQSHLPHFLWENRDAGLLGIPAEDIIEEPVVDTSKSKKKSADPVVEEVPEEEPVTE
jgi:hypothetical protein